MLRFGLLGPVEVRLDGQTVALGGPKQRALLALLVLSANEVVSRQRLIAGLWGDEPPRGVEHALDAQVSTLRHTLAYPGSPAIERRSPGYRFLAEPDAVDITRFDQLVATGRDLLADGDAAGAATTLRGALDLWRGPALADVEGAPFAGEVARELEQRRVDAVEDRVDADLACGRATQLVAELEGLVRVHPFRERLLAALVLALYRAGQQARALEVVASARHQFATELGIQPGAAVLELEGRVLRQDPALIPARAATVIDPPRDAARPARHVRRRNRLLAAGLVPVLVLGAAFALTEPDRDVGNAVASADEATLVSVDLGSGRPRAFVALPSTPTAIVAGQTGIWVSESARNEVSLVDPRSATIVAGLPMPGAPGAMAVGDGAIWVAGTVGGSVVRIDEQTRQVTQTITIGGSPSALVFAADRLWVADHNGRRLIVINPNTGSVQNTVPLADRPAALAADPMGVWVASHDADSVTLIDTESASTVASVHVGGGPAALAVGDGSVWVANNDDSTVSRLDPHTARLQATVPVSSGPASLAFMDGTLWAAGEHADTLGGIDPARNALTREISTRGSPVAVTSAFGNLWVGTRPTSDVRGGQLTMLATVGPSTVDPGFQLLLNPPQLAGLTHDGLVTFNHDSGPTGLQLVPDLAVALPVPTRSATAFTFQLRPGIRYSTGAPVRAGDFRRAIERLFRGSSPGMSYFTGLVGAGRCAERPPTCALPRGVVTNDTAGTVTFRLAAPDPDFPFRLSAMNYAAPVPAGTPMRDTGMVGIPGTGPYQIVHADVHEIRLERNPLFHEWSYAAQPEGNPDAVVWRFGLDRDAQVSAVLRGDADWMFQGVPADRWPEVKNHNIAQVHSEGTPETDFLLLRTQAPPFDDVRVRRALNLAIDRRLVVQIFGGSEQATPTCQILPPGTADRVPFCPYTREPTVTGQWSAPDLRRARRLVAASGTGGMRVTVLGITDDLYPPGDVARAAARALSQLGYQVDLQMMTRADLERLPEHKQNGFDVTPFAWYADFPSPATFFQTILTCGAPLIHGRICNQALDRQINRAMREEATGSSPHDNLWSAIDRRATQQALTVPLANPRSVELTSSRLHGYEYNPQWGFLPAQANLR